MRRKDPSNEPPSRKPDPPRSQRNARKDSQPQQRIGKPEQTPPGASLPSRPPRLRLAGELDDVASARDTGEQVLAAFANVSRRIDDLARELRCLGYFTDGEDDNRPRAA